MQNLATINCQIFSIEYANTHGIIFNVDSGDILGLKLVHFNFRL